MNKYVLLVFGLLICHLLSAQSIAISGSIDIEDASPENSKVIVVKNGKQVDEQILNKKGHFDLKLSFDVDYKLIFEKTGYVSKIISVNTEIPEEILESNSNFPPTKVVVTLLPHVENIDLSVFSQAIAIFSYNDEIDDFIFDKEYAGRIKDRIALAEQKIMEALNSQSAEALELEQKLNNLLTQGQKSFEGKEWNQAITFWSQALEIKPENEDVKQKIELARKEMELESSRLAIEKQNEQAYKLLITAADDLFNLKEYIEAKGKYNEAIQFNSNDPYPVDRIKQINEILANLAKQEADKIERREEERINALKGEYDLLITKADEAFRKENYALAKLRYTEADQLNLGEEYPKEQLLAINKMINSSQYKAKLAEYNKNIILAEKNKQQKNYAGAKVYYQKALSILSVNKDSIEKQIIEIDKLIAAAQLAEMEKAYKEVIDKADKTNAEKAYAVARFYYKKALEIKVADKYATDKLQEVEKQIKERQSKEAQF